MPLFATELGSLWIRFDSAQFWQSLCDGRLFEDDSYVQKFETNGYADCFCFELVIEYGLDVISNLPDPQEPDEGLVVTISADANDCEIGPNDGSKFNLAPQTRRVCLGFQIKLLRSSRAPLKLQNLKMVFEDDLVVSKDSKESPFPIENSLSSQDLKSQAFLYGDIEPVLPLYTLPSVRSIIHS